MGNVQIYNNVFFDKKISYCWKGISAIFIMLGHIIVPDMVPVWISFFLSGSLWVGVFFFYSGYGLMISIENKSDYLKGFWIRKIRTIFFPFMIAETLYYFVVNIGFKNEPISFSSLLRVLGGIHLVNKVLWYVIELLVLCLLFYLFEILKIKTIFWLVLYVLFIIISAALDIDTCWYMSTIGFILGIYYKQTNFLIKKIYENKIVCRLIIVIFCLMYTLMKWIALSGRKNIFGLIPVNYFIVALTMLLVPLFLIVVMIVSEKFYGGRMYVWTKLGQLSYHLYLYHMLVAAVIWHYFGKNNITTIFIAIISIVLSIIMCIIANKLNDLKYKK